jgi:hypothetical protein
MTIHNNVDSSLNIFLIEQYTVQYTVLYTVQYTVQYTVLYIVQYTIQYTVQYTSVVLLYIPFGKDSNCNV